MTSDEKQSLQQLQENLGHTFTNQDLLQEALTHPSCMVGMDEPHCRHYQRLEFLGDAVLGLHLADRLFALHPETREGELSQMRASLVRGSTLSEIARKLRLGEYLRLSQGEESTGGRDRDNLLEDAFEALVGALYLDAGMAKTSKILTRLYGESPQQAKKVLAEANPKGQLQEFLQAQEISPTLKYRLVSREGPDHDRVFTAEVYLDDEPFGKGKGSSKKRAEELAAQEALRKLTNSPS
ncbi:MAG: ribonuclease III [Opitutales bacterium]|nr:ribonuclease III [Opitutales bacterium]